MTKKPPFRKLRGYAFDPSLSMQLDTVVINDITYKIDWEDFDPNEQGIIGEYIEVLDFDPASNAIYKPVNLNDPYILASDGLDPSESNPQFHQQMCYAVVMTTIKNFELALGRKALWRPRFKESGPNRYKGEYIQRLRIYPHALREANAYYSPQKKALLFGYFSASPDDITQHMPGGLVFSCLSHDIIAHETAHALLDGMYSGYTSPTNPDVLAFHEAFADIVALFQHFTFSAVLKHQIAKTKGNLEDQSLLGQLAQEFGKAIGHYGALRDAIGEKDANGNWQIKKPDPMEYEQEMESHKRGSILVAAVFETFLNIYKKRVADLLRIATGGSGVLPDGELHPDLVNRLSNEASKTAGHILRICIRALDYCPPVDITFGDYLRGIITADFDMVKDDEWGYRIAFVEAFRKRGIYPKGIKTLSVESLVYTAENIEVLNSQFNKLGEFLRGFKEKISYVKDRKKIFEITGAYISGTPYEGENIQGLHERLDAKFDGSREFEKLTGLKFSLDWKAVGVRTSDFSQGPTYQVHSLKVANRVGPEGNIINQIVLSLIQKAGVRFTTDHVGVFQDEKVFFHPFPLPDNEERPANMFEIKGGCTLIFDLDSLRLKYCISKPLLSKRDLLSGRYLLDPERVQSHYDFLFGDSDNDVYGRYFSEFSDKSSNEPFAFLHR
ncbi:MAG: hypothetical protein ACJ751_19060 [Niastella sp.]|jgi:hypothetical protein|uniref:hypothetical protein n=1 Tax=Niastella sp. TaxID=1869183 RepID=UPI003899E655